MEITIDTKYRLSEVVEVVHTASSGYQNKAIGPIEAIRVIIHDDGSTQYDYKVKNRFYPDSSVVGCFTRMVEK